MAAATFGFMAGVAVGSSGCCWGNCNWGGGDVDIDVNRNNNFTKNNYNRDRVTHYQKQRGQRAAGSNGSITQKTEKEPPTEIMLQPRSYNRGTSAEAARSREANRGRAEQGRQDLSKGSAGQRGGFDGGARASTRTAVEHSAAWTAAAVQKTSAAVDNRAVKACPVAVADSVAVVAAAVEDSAAVRVAVVAGSAVVPVAAVAADAAAVEEEGGRYVKISFKRNTSGKGG